MKIKNVLLILLVVIGLLVLGIIVVNVDIVVVKVGDIVSEIVLMYKMIIKVI